MIRQVELLILIRTIMDPGFKPPSLLGAARHEKTHKFDSDQQQQKNLKRSTLLLTNSKGEEKTLTTGSKSN